MIRTNIFFRLRVFLLLSVLVGAISIHATEVVGQSMDGKCSIAPIKLEERILRRTYDAVRNDSNCWVESICSAIASFGQKEYNQFIGLVREESTSSRTGGGRHFLLYTTNENRSRAFECLQAKANGATPETQMHLYWVLQSAPQRIAVSPLPWLVKAAQSGLPSAQYRVSELILSHYGRAASAPSEISAELTIDKYKEWLSKAAASGFPAAQFSLGQYYEGLHSNFGTYSPDAKAAVEWYKRAAAQSADERIRDSARAQLGHLYFVGKIVPRNYEEALRWYKQIASEKTQNPCANRLVNVRFNMMTIYQDELGVEKDPEKAKELSKVPFACEKSSS